MSNPSSRSNVSDTATTAAPSSASASACPCGCIVDYEDADDFIGDYTENLSAGGHVHSHDPRARARHDHPLVLSFPGLLHRSRSQGIVRWSRGGKQPGVGIEFRPTPTTTSSMHSSRSSTSSRSACRRARHQGSRRRGQSAHRRTSSVPALARRRSARSATRCSFNFATAENGAGPPPCAVRTAALTSRSSIFSCPSSTVEGDRIGGG